MSPQDKSYLDLSNALRQVLARPQLAAELKSSDTKHQAMEQLGIDDEGMAREIINVLMAVDPRPPPPPPKPRPKGCRPGLRPPPPPETDRDFLFESFRQLRAAYRTSMTMSVVMFAIGVAFLAMAAIRSFTDPGSIAITSVIGGIGVVQIVALFYRNPLSDIAQTVSNSQQAKMAVTSYLLGITLLNEQIRAGGIADVHFGHLFDLTERALGQLEAYAGGSKATARTAIKPPVDQPVNKVDE